MLKRSYKSIVLIGKSKCDINLNICIFLIINFRLGDWWV